MSAPVQSCQPIPEPVRQHPTLVERLREVRGVLDNRWPGPSAMDLEAADYIESLESNAREQAKLLADTGRRVEEMAHPYRCVDDLDWRHLLSFIPDSGHGRFWKAVFEEVRATIGSKQ